MFACTDMLHLIQAARADTLYQPSAYLLTLFTTFQAALPSDPGERTC